MKFNGLHTALVSYGTTTENVLRECNFPDTIPDSIESRTLAALTTWIEGASTDWLIRFVRCISGQGGVIRGNTMEVYIHYE
jgi:hypothetical protein